MDELIYVRTAAKILCCTKTHVYNMVQDGRLKAVRLGPRGLRVVKGSVAQYIEENKVVVGESRGDN